MVEVCTIVYSPITILICPVGCRSCTCNGFLTCIIIYKQPHAGVLPRLMVLTESELSGSYSPVCVIIYTGLEINIEEANYTIQEDAASNLVVRLQIEYEVLFHVLQTGNAILLRHLNVVTQIGVRSIGENSTCSNIEVGLDGCRVSI